MPTFSRLCCSDSAVAFSFGRSARKAMVVAKPLGWPHWVSSSLALTASPLLSAPAG